MLSRSAILDILHESDESRIRDVYRRARLCKRRLVGNVVYLRGLIEFSNICVRNCLYCGIRRDLAQERYALSQDEIVGCAWYSARAGYGSVVLQSGERTDPAFVRYVERAVRRIKGLGPRPLGITLSCGEQSEETYRRWYAAGAHRYLLRIETSDAALFSRMHPADQIFERRMRCLETLQKIGFQTGTGVMIGMPGQTIEQLAEDILFFGRIDADMIGMGPYVAHSQTPIKDAELTFSASQRLELSLKMIAATRLHLGDVNIAAATALQSLHPMGREQAIRAGANIIMPNVTPHYVREQYQLYENKACIKEKAEQCRPCLDQRILSTGNRIGYHHWGDAPHALRAGR